MQKYEQTVSFIRDVLDYHLTGIHSNSVHWIKPILTTVTMSPELLTPALPEKLGAELAPLRTVYSNFARTVCDLLDHATAPEANVAAAAASVHLLAACHHDLIKQDMSAILASLKRFFDAPVHPSARAFALRAAVRFPDFRAPPTLRAAVAAPAPALRAAAFDAATSLAAASLAPADVVAQALKTAVDPGCSECVRNAALRLVNAAASTGKGVNGSINAANSTLESIAASLAALAPVAAAPAPVLAAALAAPAWSRSAPPSREAASVGAYYDAFKDLVIGDALAPCSDPAQIAAVVATAGVALADIGARLLATPVQVLVAECNPPTVAHYPINKLFAAAAALAEAAPAAAPARLGALASVRPACLRLMEACIARAGRVPGGAAVVARVAGGILTDPASSAQTIRTVDALLATTVATISCFAFPSGALMELATTALKQATKPPGDFAKAAALVSVGATLLAHTGATTSTPVLSLATQVAGTVALTTAPLARAGQPTFADIFPTSVAATAVGGAKAGKGMSAPCVATAACIADLRQAADRLAAAVLTASPSPLTAAIGPLCASFDVNGPTWATLCLLRAAPPAPAAHTTDTAAELVVSIPFPVFGPAEQEPEQPEQPEQAKVLLPVTVQPPAPAAAPAASPAPAPAAGARPAAGAARAAPAVAIEHVDAEAGFGGLTPAASLFACTLGSVVSTAPVTPAETSDDEENIIFE